MNKKGNLKDQIIEIDPVFDMKNIFYWEYRLYSEEDIQQIDKFFDDNAMHLESKMSHDAFANMEYLT